MNWKFFIPMFTHEWVAVWYSEEEDKYHIWKPLEMFREYEELPTEAAYAKCFRFLWYWSFPDQELDIFELEVVDEDEM